MGKIKIKAADGLTVITDLSASELIESPIFILCHHAGFSRGECIETAEYFLKQGFNCIAVDHSAAAA